MSVFQQQAKNLQVSHRRQWLFVGVAAAVLSTELLVGGVTPAQAATDDQAPTAVSGEKPAERVTKSAEVVNENKPGAEKTGTISSDKTTDGAGNSNDGIGSAENDTGDGQAASDGSESIKPKSKGKVGPFSARMAAPSASDPTETDPADTSSDDNQPVTDSAGFTYTKHVDEDGNTTGYDITAYSGSDTDITIPDSYQGLSVVGIGEGAFSQKGLTGVKLPDSLINISNGAFQNNFLKTITFDRALETIGNGAFLGNQLKDIVISDHVREIGDSAFLNNGATQLTLDNDLVKIGNAVFEENNIGGDLTIPDSVTEIGMMAFVNNQLTGLAFGTGKAQLKTIGINSFSHMKTLTGGLSGGPLIIPDSVKTISPAAFVNDAISSLILGKNVETIGDDAFNVNNLQGTIDIPDSVISIGDTAFDGNHLSGVKLGANVETIGNRAFGGASDGNHLTGSLIIPDKVQSIGTSAFDENQLSGMLTIPASVKTIGASAFLQNQLTGVHFLGVPDSIGNGAFVQNNLQHIQADLPVNTFDDEALATQQTLTVPVKLVNGKFIGVKQAILNKVMPTNLALNDLTFTLDDTPVTYNPTEDSLTLPDGFTGEKLTVMMTSGTSGDNSGNYGVLQLTLDGTPQSTPTTPTDPVTPSQPVNPVDPTTPVTPVQPIKPAQPIKRPTQPKKAAQKQANRHGKPTGQAVTGQRLAIGVRSAGPAMRPTTITSQLKASRQTSTQHQATLPQTGERTKLWTVIGGWLLAILGWLGLGNRRREH
ncbi:leucine-rich repeat domain-containing protein [Levilactobacillus lindianensis]|uniref:leucine-rich repeat domain-containing protein n=1 Tax=Levilactobacillus lindianensis TaxID=2486018 RepID=UPI000F749B38|nr:leucine-rich repeat domain-containing protein [Levilactobacillus lindianensis]